ncbi:hypothetical protein LguiB_005656 [Lonicera macranthoides]
MPNLHVRIDSEEHNFDVGSSNMKWSKVLESRSELEESDEDNDDKSVSQSEIEEGVNYPKQPLGISIPSRYKKIGLSPRATAGPTLSYNFMEKDELKEALLRDKAMLFDKIKLINSVVEENDQLTGVVVPTPAGPIARKGRRKKAAKKGRLKELIKSNNIIFLAVLEPMVAEHKLTSIRLQLGFDCVISNTLSNIWCFWKNELNCSLVLNDE